jgi:uncharacterized protein YndB with AHSA1/START domain
VPDPRRVGPREFSCFAPAAPHLVWVALTDAAVTPRYLYGLAARSTWRPDADIEFAATGGHTLLGRVLHIDEPHRLSYLLQSGPDGPATYLTWQLRPCHDGSAVRLQVEGGVVDEDDDDEEAENVWLPVLAALQAVLSTPATAPEV